MNRKPLLAGGSDRLVVRATRDRSDAVVFVRDATPETSTSAASLKEIDETLKLGMPIFVLRADQVGRAAARTLAGTDLHQRRGRTAS